MSEMAQLLEMMQKQIVRATSKFGNTSSFNAT